ncbi:UPF0182 family protein [Schumannella soli]|uniref:UPF0182 protein FJ657_08400 n=1 Tax=Schumannella soli TaxID=2590779 RepID=A0A506Y6E6_9MICO|nr:UPF0182 family protein [Schumannella soli]
MVAAIVAAFFIFASLYTDFLWYDQLGFQNVLTTQWFASIVMFAIGFVGMAVPVFLSVQVAFRSRPVYAKLSAQLDRYQQVVEPLRRLAMFGVPAVLGLFMGVSTAMRWQTVLEYLNRTPFGVKDPQFGLDNSFYVFELPFFHGVLGYASAVVIVAGIAMLATHYLYGGIRVGNREVRITRAARVQIAVTAAVFLLLQAVSIYLDQFSTLTDTRGVSSLFTGATFTDVNAVIPGKLILAIAFALVTVLCIVTAVIGRWRLPIIGTGLLVVASLVIGTAYPALIQRFQVDPSALSLERDYIQRNIKATQVGYNIDGIDTVAYSAKTDVEQGALRDDADTTASIRLIDPNVVSPTFAQLQQVQQYYQFDDKLDVDRYTIDGTTQDTVIAVRELDQSNQKNPTWLTNTAVYTHGYGVVAAYGNQRSEDGQPNFLESGIPSRGELGDYEPRIYFGQKSPTYSIVGAPKSTSPVEIDYPSSDKDDDSAARKYTYTGDGGPKLDNAFKQLVYAIKFGSEQIILSDAVNSDSQILYDRNPIDRVKKAAPYLTIDRNAYPAIVNKRVVWIVDGYTTTANYPYSQVEQLSSSIADTNTPQPEYALDDVNYIRNSVKATVDAYSGKVTLYAWDDKDPLLKTYSKIFPGTLESQKDMSTQLLEHVRYPEDLFKMQRSILETYHVTNPSTWYARDDQWATPTDPTASKEEADKKQPPYYLTMKVPGTDKPAFTLYSTFIPASAKESRSVLKGYLTANADYGADYGKLTLLTLPKDDTVPGPGQVQNTFNSSDDVATQLNILQRGDTTVVRGNLLTVPVGGGLLYVQPVYVKSSGETSYPLLRKVLVAFGDKVEFEDTLNLALDKLFDGDSGAAAGDNGVTPGDGGDSSGGDSSGSGGTDAGSGTGAGDGSTGSGSGTGTGTGTGDNAALKKALSDYSTALADRNKAYADNDLVAAAEADKRMQAAVEAAIAAAGD